MKRNGVIYFVVLVLSCAGIFFASGTVAVGEEKTKSIWVKADEMMAEKKYVEAVKLYSIAIEINEEDPDIYYAYYNRAQAFINLNKVDEAVSDYTKAIKLNPKFKDAYKMRAIVYLNTNRYTEAANDFSRLIDLDPADSSAYANRGIALSYMGSYDKALADFSKAIEIDDACAACYYNRYQLYTIMGKNGEAQIDLEKAQLLDPRYKGEK